MVISKYEYQTKSGCVVIGTEGVKFGSIAVRKTGEKDGLFIMTHETYMIKSYTQALGNLLDEQYEAGMKEGVEEGMKVAVAFQIAEEAYAQVG